jgi:hypothetical protein
MLQGRELATVGYTIIFIVRSWTNCAHIQINGTLIHWRYWIPYSNEHIGKPLPNSSLPRHAQALDCHLANYSFISHDSRNFAPKSWSTTVRSCSHIHHDLISLQLFPGITWHSNYSSKFRTPATTNFDVWHSQIIHPTFCGWYFDLHVMIHYPHHFCRPTTHAP